MELSIASLEWLVLGAGRELMLFASVGILLFGIDDLLFDGLWIATNGRAGAVSTLANASSSCCIRKPVAVGRPVMPLTELCARWAAPNASLA